MRGEEQSSDDLGEDEEGDEPSPHEETEIEIVPESNKSEDDEEVEDLAGFGKEYR